MFSAKSVKARCLLTRKNWVRSKSVVFSPEGRDVLSGSVVKTIRIWNVCKLEEVGVSTPTERGM